MGIDIRMTGALRHPNVLVVANHVSWLDIFVLHAVGPVRFIAKAEIARWPVVGAWFAASARCSSSASAGTTRIASTRRSRDALAARRHRRGLSGRHDDRRHRHCCRSRARCCSRSSMRRGTCSPSRSATETPDGDPSTAPGVCRRRHVRRLVLAHVRRARARRRADGDRAVAGARQAPARARARGRRRYPDGFGVTGDATRHLVDAPVRQAEPP